jgi:hypothetical protein
MTEPSHAGNGRGQRTGESPLVGGARKAAESMIVSPHRSHSTSASIARRMGAESIGQTATIRANSAAKTPTSETAPDCAAHGSKNLEFPVFSGGVLVLSSPLSPFVTTCCISCAIEETARSEGLRCFRANRGKTRACLDHGLLALLTDADLYGATHCNQCPCDTDAVKLRTARPK